MSVDGANVVLISGRIARGSVKREDLFYTEIALPALDEYSQPGLVEVRSNVKLGSRDDDISGRCRIGGFRRRAFDVTDKGTGEVRTVRPVSVTLDWVA